MIPDAKRGVIQDEAVSCGVGGCIDNGSGSSEVDVKVLQVDGITESKRPNLIVIGAGVAGLRAADVLLEAGCNVTVLEARDRIGGRVASSSALGLPVDLGPNWVHGTIGNPIHDIARKAKLTLHDSIESTSSVMNSKGSYIDPVKADAISTRMWELFEEGIEWSEIHRSNTEISENFYDYVKGRLEREVPDKEERIMCLQMCEEIGDIVAGEIKKQSLRNLFLERPIPGENLFVSSTYGPIFDIIAQPALKGAKILLDSPVEKIERVGKGEKRHHRVVLRQGKGEFIADGVILAVPLGCLQRRRIEFVPELPVRILDHADNLGYGSLEKTYIAFPQAFWKSETSVDSEFYTFLAPEYAMDTNPEQWHVSIMSLAHLAKPYNHPTLLFYTHGPISEHITGLKQKYGVDADAMITKFFEPYFSRLPNYSPEDPRCKPSGMVVTNWLNDEFAGNGSYTNFPVGLDKGDEDIEALREGWGEEKLWLAGEHAAPLLGLASVSGAYWSGESAGRMALREFGLLPKDASIHTAETLENFALVAPLIGRVEGPNEELETEESDECPSPIIELLQKDDQEWSHDLIDKEEASLASQLGLMAPFVVPEDETNAPDGEIVPPLA